MKSKTLIALMTTVLSTTSFAEIHTSLKNAGFSENHAPLSDLLNNEALLKNEALNATNALSTEDLAYAFDNSENLNLTAMSEQDMQNTQGAWSISHNLMLGATLGGIGGHYGYLAPAIIRDEYSLSNHLGAIVSGALGGAIGAGISPISGVNSALAVTGGAFATTGTGTYLSTLDIDF